MKTRAVVLLGCALVGCGSEDQAPVPPVADTFAAPPEGQGFQLSMKLDAPAGTEVWKCLVGKLPDTIGFFAAHHVESRQTAGIHHMDVMALALTGVSIEPGMHDCRALYDEHAELMEKGIFLYAAQAPEQEITLPEGVAAMVPSAMEYMQEIHFVNATPEDIAVESVVNAWTIPQEQVTQTIWGTVVRDSNIHVPAASKHVEWTRCTMTADVDVLFLSSHTHQLGRRVTVSKFDGAEVGAQIYENDDWHTPLLMDFEEPLHVAKGEGFEFACEFDNPNDHEVVWGMRAEDEMCQIGLVFTPGDSAIECAAVASSDGVL